LNSFFTHSTPSSPAAWAWDYQFVVRSSKRTGGEYGRARMSLGARSFNSAYLQSAARPVPLIRPASAGGMRKRYREQRREPRSAFRHGERKNLNALQTGLVIIRHIVKKHNHSMADTLTQYCGRYVRHCCGHGLTNCN